APAAEVVLPLDLVHALEEAQGVQQLLGPVRTPRARPPVVAWYRSLRSRGTLELPRPGRGPARVQGAPAGRAAAPLGDRQLRPVARADAAGACPGEGAATGAAGLQGGGDGGPGGTPGAGRVV